MCCRVKSAPRTPAKVYKVGQTFFKPAGSLDLVSENGSVTKPASLPAVFVDDNGSSSICLLELQQGLSQVLAYVQRTRGRPAIRSRLANAEGFAINANASKRNYS
jgi:hypothetical protein